MKKEVFLVMIQNENLTWEPRLCPMTEVADIVWKNNSKVRVYRLISGTPQKMEICVYPNENMVDLRDRFGNWVCGAYYED